MFNSLRYGSGRLVALGLLVALFAAGGYYGYSKVTNAGDAEIATPNPSTSVAPSETVIPGNDKPEPTETTIDGGSQDKSATDPIKEPFVSMPLPKGANQPSEVRGDAKDGEVFTYVIIPGDEIDVAAAFFKKELTKLGWKVEVTEGERQLFRISNKAWSGDIILSIVDKTKMTFMGILKPVVE